MSQEVSGDLKPLCKYGDKCYRKNPDHIKAYKHSSKDDENLVMDDKEEVTSPTKKLKYNNSTTPNYDEIKNGSAKSSEDPVLMAVPPSPSNIRENIKEKFLLDMPEDFFDFWEFCKEINEENPEDALADDLNLTLVGPYDVLNGTLSKKFPSDCLCHWRFYHDPPEFQTVIVGKKDEFHMGYFRDDPIEDPVFVASMSSVRPGIITPLGENIFAAVSLYTHSQMSKTDTFKKPQLAKLVKRLENFAKNKKLNLDSKTDNMKERQKKVVTKSFHGAGIVVPYDKENDIGYRELPETDGSLKKILRKIVDAPTKEKKMECLVSLQELITNVQWATDEGDFGMGLELGIDLFIFGGEEFHSSIKHLLTVAYDLLGRAPFSTILKTHLANRRKGPNMSII